MTASNAMSDVVTTLALAHYLFDDVQRSVQRARLLEAWFRTDTAIIPGVPHSGMGSCIVTSRRWNSRFTDAVALLRSTGAPTA